MPGNYRPDGHRDGFFIAVQTHERKLFVHDNPPSLYSISRRSQMAHEIQ
ncbi:hypothetical protein SAMN05660226_02307 [Parapedobacter luteus]|uniref:Uncharacterized protein n=1 Tax=Parapedobacter luteus TaxID=623280 RepID=A0A1T5CSP3_9SPHI|nr:hypothetical protein SAMN05660226_02307 [Parapedobacter luteus]